jgi:hypothetical protein
MIPERRRWHDLDWVRIADPLRDRSVGHWSDTDVAAQLLRQILADDRPGHTHTRAGRGRRHAVRPLLVALAVIAVGGGVAGARLLLGGPAPAAVQHDIGAVDQGMPADLRFNPDVHNARLVAQSDGAQLYAADLVGGGYCAEIVTPDGRPAGAVCTPTQTLSAQSIGVTVPFVDPVAIDSPFVVGGRVNVAGVASLGAVFGDGTSQMVMLGEGGFFVFAVSPAHLTEAHLYGLSLVASDEAGVPIADVNVPATDFTNPQDQDAKQPIFVSTISTQDDFTKVLGIEGSVNVAAAFSLELQYPDGSIVDVPLGANGEYDYELPADHRGDLFARPGWLVARDAQGNEIATAPVAAVAYWRSVESSP